MTMCADCEQHFESEADLERHQMGGCSVAERREKLEDAGLTERQATAWTLSEQGYTASEIAGLMEIQEGTVKSHLQRVREKKKEAEKLLEVMEEDG